MAVYHAVIKNAVTIGHGGATEKFMRGQMIASLTSGSTLETEIGTSNLDNIATLHGAGYVPNGHGTSN